MTEDIKPATPLPWAYESNEREWVRGSKRTPVVGGHYTGHEHRFGGRKPSGHVARDLQYIVHTANAYPTLKAENDRLREAFRPLIEACDDLLIDLGIYDIDNYSSNAPKVMTELAPEFIAKLKVAYAALQPVEDREYANG